MTGDGWSARQAARAVRVARRLAARAIALRSVAPRTVAPAAQVPAIVPESEPAPSVEGAVLTDAASARPNPAATWDPVEFRVPTRLQVTPTPLRRVLVVGSCMVEGLPEWMARAEPPTEGDYVLFNFTMQLPDIPPHPVEEYDFQIVQIPLRSVVPEFYLMRLGYDDAEGYQQLVDTCMQRLQQLLDAGLVYCERHGLLSLVTNLIVPQADLVGRLTPRADIRNLVHLVQTLNQVLHEEVARRQNAYVLDIDGMSAALGRSLVQDDSIWMSLHGGVLTDWDHERDQARLQPTTRVSDTIPVRSAEFLRLMWREAVAMYRTVRQVDSVKLVIVDLDDTLWRGVVAEGGQISTDTTEGWPKGFIEALLALKRRGVLLAIVSKNDEERISALWPEIFGGVLRFEDFAAVRINWDPKPLNVEAVIAAVNVLPKSVVFIDDNPVERAAVRAAFPDIRVLGDDPYELRRVLLWSPETQVASITAESGRRTEMVQAQIRREDQRSRLSREAFLASLQVRVRLDVIDSVSHASFNRALELTNKTNQFNSTGERWTATQAAELFAAGGRFLAFTVEDVYTSYGLTAVLIESGGEVRQLLMSCRILGLDVELAILRCAAERARAAGLASLRIRCVDTGVNSLVRAALEKHGFAAEGEWWSVAADTDFGGGPAVDVVDAAAVN